MGNQQLSTSETFDIYYKLDVNPYQFKEYVYDFSIRRYDSD